ncbi:hypothetical protein ACFWEG_08715, partial [Streptomyces sp. NPDC060194]
MPDSRPSPEPPAKPADDLIETPPAADGVTLHPAATGPAPEPAPTAAPDAVPPAVTRKGGAKKATAKKATAKKATAKRASAKKAAPKSAARRIPAQASAETVQPPVELVASTAEVVDVIERTAAAVRDSAATGKGARTGEQDAAKTAAKKAAKKAARKRTPLAASAATAPVG